MGVGMARYDTLAGWPTGAIANEELSFPTVKCEIPLWLVHENVLSSMNQGNTLTLRGVLDNGPGASPVNCLVPVGD